MTQPRFDLLPPMRLLALLMLILLALLSAPRARADSPIVLFKSFAGNVNFTGAEKTMRTADNGTNACSISNSTLTMPLTGLPSGATVLSAQLYWAGSSSNPDYTVSFEGTNITALATRQYTSATVGYDFFGGAYDVTAQVVAKGNGNYSVSGLTINNGSPYCSVEAVLGGFQMLVVYSLPSESFRVLNIYEGFRYIKSSNVTLTLSNFQIPSPIGSLSGRVGHITWEGDSSLSGGGEILRYNTVEMVDLLNPTGNQFNSVSNINGDQNSYGIDFDAYTVSSPVIKSGDTQATTYYESGPDLVLMNAEIIAAPNVPATDRGITMILTGTLAPTQISTYTINVINNGPLAETRAVVTDVLPSNLIYTGATGTNWTCTNAQQTVTCVYNLSLAVGASAPPILLKVTPTLLASGLVSNSATVNGNLFDYYDGNNTATSSTTIGVAAFTPTYMFTDAPCVHAQAFGSASQPCHPVAWTRQTSNVDVRGIYLTFVSNGIPVSIDTADKTMQMKFALSCHNPATNAGKRATFSAVSTALPLCVANGAVPGSSSSAWSGFVGVVFTANTPSSALAYIFNYPDVGRIELLASDDTNRLGTTNPFVSMPDKLILSANAGSVINAGTVPAAYGNTKFTAAGAPFTMTMRAMTGGITPVVATNFGNESPQPVINMVSTLALDANGATFPEMRAAQTGDLSGSFSSFSGGIATGTFVYAEVGLIQVKQDPDPTRTFNYLGGGTVNSDPLNVGRFVPDHFNTITATTIVCPAALACPSSVSGMAYAKQPFSVEVDAYAAGTTPVQNYTGGFAKVVTLTPYTTMGGGTVAGASVPLGVLTLNSIAAANFSVLAGATSPTTLPVRDGAFANPVYSFTATTGTFSSSSPATTGQVNPKTIYMRAVDSDGVTSLQTSSVEGGVMIVSGRLVIPNAYGSELLPLPLVLQAQYYSNNQWVNSTLDNISTLTPSTGIAFANCYRLTCSALHASGTPSLLTFTGGTATALLPKPGISGYVDVTASSPAWLPSTKTRIVYGVYRSPLIYIRELY